MSIPKNKYRCCGCDRFVSNRNQVFIPWSKSTNSDLYAFCRSCAKQKLPNESGRALTRRLMDNWVMSYE